MDITVAGGVPPYTYAWSNGEATEDVSGLAEGTYEVTVSDLLGATATATFTVDEYGYVNGMSASKSKSAPDECSDSSARSEASVGTSKKTKSKKTNKGGAAVLGGTIGTTSSTLVAAVVASVVVVVIAMAIVKKKRAQMRSDKHAQPTDNEESPPAYVDGQAAELF